MTDQNVLRPKRDFVATQLHLQAEAIAREVLGNRTILDASEIAAARAEINQRLEALRRPEQREAA